MEKWLIGKKKMKEKRCLSSVVWSLILMASMMGFCQRTHSHCLDHIDASYEREVALPHLVVRVLFLSLDVPLAHCKMIYDMHTASSLNQGREQRVKKKNVCSLRASIVCSLAPLLSLGASTDNGKLDSPKKCCSWSSAPSCHESVQPEASSMSCIGWFPARMWAFSWLLFGLPKFETSFFWRLDLGSRPTTKETTRQRSTLKRSSRSVFTLQLAESSTCCDVWGSFVAELGCV
jgi:hypothetical protein